jgi:hypothetical protein
MGLDTSKAQLLDDLRNEQDGFEALLDEIGEQSMAQPGVAGDWSIKDVVAHLTSWRRRTVARFQAALRHEPEPATDWPPYLPTDDEINVWIYAANRDKSVADVRRESRETFEQLLETLASFPEADLHDSARFPWLDGETWNGAAFFGHYHDEHEQDMRAWLAQHPQAQG